MIGVIGYAGMVLFAMLFAMQCAVARTARKNTVDLLEIAEGLLVTCDTWKSECDKLVVICKKYEEMMKREVKL